MSLAALVAQIGAHRVTSGSTFERFCVMKSSFWFVSVRQALSPECVCSHLGADGPRVCGADLPFKEAPTPEFRDQWKLETEMAMEPFLLENPWRRSIRLFFSVFLLERLDKVNVRHPPSGGRL